MKLLLLFLSLLRIEIPENSLIVYIPNQPLYEHQKMDIHILSTSEAQFDMHLPDIYLIDEAIQYLPISYPKTTAIKKGLTTIPIKSQKGQPYGLSLYMHAYSPTVKR